MCTPLKLTFLIILNLIFSELKVDAYIRFSNLKCKSLDESFATIPRCDLKVVGRGKISGNMIVQLHKVPVHEVSAKVDFYRKSHDYRPFLYNVSVDFCDFMVKRKRYPVFNVFFEFISKSSNINHSCPYDHDIIVKDYIISEDQLKLFPVATGDYRVDVYVGAYKIWRANFSIYVKVDW